MVATTRADVRVDDKRAPRPNYAQSPVIDPPLGLARVRRYHVDLWTDLSRGGVVSRKTCRNTCTVHSILTAYGTVRHICTWRPQWW